MHFLCRCLCSTLPTYMFVLQQYSSSFRVFVVVVVATGGAVVVGVMGVIIADICFWCVWWSPVTQGKGASIKCVCMHPPPSAFPLSSAKGSTRVKKGVLPSLGCMLYGVGIHLLPWGLLPFRKPVLWIPIFHYRCCLACFGECVVHKPLNS